MFKQIIHNFFKRTFFYRVIILTLISVLLFTVYALCNGLLARLFPNEEISALTEIAATIFSERDVGVLKDIADEKSDILKFYTIEENSNTDTITVNLYGRTGGIVILKITRSYCFTSLIKSDDHFSLILLILITFLGVCLYYCVIFSLICNCVIKFFEVFFGWIKKRKNYFT